MDAAKTMGVYDPSWEEPTAADIGLAGIADEPETLTWEDAFSGSFMENLAEMTPIIAGAKELHEVKGLWDAANRIKQDVDNDTQNATAEDYALVREYMEEAAANKTWGYKFASILKGLVPFAGEMFIGMGAARKAASMTGFKLLSESLEETIDRAGKRKLARTFRKQADALEKTGKDAIEVKGLRDSADKITKTAGENLSWRAVGDAAKIALAGTAGAEALTSGVGAIPGGWSGVGGRSRAAAYARSLRNAGLEVTPDEAGRLEITFNSTLDDFWDNIGYGILETATEQFTERMGGTLMAIPGINRLQGLQSSVYARFAKKHNLSSQEAIERINKFGWDGPVEEWLEERLGTGVRGLTLVGEDEFIVHKDDGGKYSINTDLFVPELSQWTAELAAFTVPAAAAHGIRSYFGVEDPLARARGIRSLDEAETAANRRALEEAIVEKLGQEDLDTLKNPDSKDGDVQEVVKRIQADTTKGGLNELAQEAGIEGFRQHRQHGGKEADEVDHEAARWARGETRQGWEHKQGEPARIVAATTKFQRRLQKMLAPFVEVVFVEGGKEFESRATSWFSPATKGDGRKKGVIYINAGMREDKHGALFMLKKGLHELVHAYDVMDESHLEASFDAITEIDGGLAAKMAWDKYRKDSVLALHPDTSVDALPEAAEKWEREVFGKGLTEEQLENKKKKEIRAYLAEDQAELLQFLMIDNGVDYINKLKEKKPKAIEHIRDFFVKQLNRFRSEVAEIPTGVDARMERLEKQLRKIGQSSKSLEIATHFNEALQLMRADEETQNTTVDEAPTLRDEDAAAPEEQVPDEVLEGAAPTAAEEAPAAEDPSFDMPEIAAPDPKRVAATRRVKEAARRSYEYMEGLPTGRDLTPEEEKEYWRLEVLRLLAERDEFAAQGIDKGAADREESARILAERNGIDFEAALAETEAAAATEAPAPKATKDSAEVKKIMRSGTRSALETRAAKAGVKDPSSYKNKADLSVAIANAEAVTQPLAEEAPAAEEAPVAEKPRVERRSIHRGKPIEIKNAQKTWTGVELEPILVEDEDGGVHRLDFADGRMHYTAPDGSIEETRVKRDKQPGFGLDPIQDRANELLDLPKYRGKAGHQRMREDARKIDKTVPQSVLRGRKANLARWIAEKEQEGENELMRTGLDAPPTPAGRRPEIEAKRAQALARKLKRLAETGTDPERDRGEVEQAAGPAISGLREMGELGEFEEEGPAPKYSTPVDVLGSRGEEQVRQLEDLRERAEANLREQEELLRQAVERDIDIETGEFVERAFESFPERVREREGLLPGVHASYLPAAAQEQIAQAEELRGQIPESSRERISREEIAAIKESVENLKARREEIERDLAEVRGRYGDPITEEGRAATKEVAQTLAKDQDEINRLAEEYAKRDEADQDPHVRETLEHAKKHGRHKAILDNWWLVRGRTVIAGPFRSPTRGKKSIEDVFIHGEGVRYIPLGNDTGLAPDQETQREWEKTARLAHEKSYPAYVKQRAYEETLAMRHASDGKARRSYKKKNGEQVIGWLDVVLERRGKELDNLNKLRNEVRKQVNDVKFNRGAYQSRKVPKLPTEPRRRGVSKSGKVLTEAEMVEVGARSEQRVAEGKEVGGWVDAPFRTLIVAMNEDRYAREEKHKHPLVKQGKWKFRTDKSDMRDKDDKGRDITDLMWVLPNSKVTYEDFVDGLPATERDPEARFLEAWDREFMQRPSNLAVVQERKKEEERLDDKHREEPGKFTVNSRAAKREALQIARKSIFGGEIQRYLIEGQQGVGDAPIEAVKGSVLFTGQLRDELSYHPAGAFPLSGMERQEFTPEIIEEVSIQGMSRYDESSPLLEERIGEGGATGEDITLGATEADLEGSASDQQLIQQQVSDAYFRAGVTPEGRTEVQQRALEGRLEGRPVEGDYESVGKTDVRGWEFSPEILAKGPDSGAFARNVAWSDPGVFVVEGGKLTVKGGDRGDETGRETRWFKPKEDPWKEGGINDPARVAERKRQKEERLKQEAQKLEDLKRERNGTNPANGRPYEDHEVAPNESPDEIARGMRTRRQTHEDNARAGYALADGAVREVLKDHTFTLPEQEQTEEQKLLAAVQGQAPQARETRLGLSPDQPVTRAHIKAAKQLYPDSLVNQEAADYVRAMDPRFTENTPVTIVDFYNAANQQRDRAVQLARAIRLYERWDRSYETLQDFAKDNPQVAEALMGARMQPWRYTYIVVAPKGSMLTLGGELGDRVQSIFGSEGDAVALLPLSGKGAGSTLTDVPLNPSGKGSKAFDYAGHATRIPAQVAEAVKEGELG